MKKLALVLQTPEMIMRKFEEMEAVMGGAMRASGSTAAAAAAASVSAATSTAQPFPAHDMRADKGTTALKQGAAAPCAAGVGGTREGGTHQGGTREGAFVPTPGPSGSAAACVAGSSALGGIGQRTGGDDLNGGASAQALVSTQQQVCLHACLCECKCKCKLRVWTRESGSAAVWRCASACTCGYLQRCCK